MNSKRKGIERKYAHALLRHLNLRNALLHDHEKPDFLFDFDGCTFGIEVTRLMRKEHNGVQFEHVQESEQLNVVSLGRTRYIELGGDPLHVCVHFNSNRVDKRNRQSVAFWIADLVFQNPLAVDQLLDWNWYSSEYGTYPDCMSAVSAIRLPNSKQHFWATPRSGWPNARFDEVVTEAVQSKEAKCNSYLRKCDECWLLLVADWERGVSFFEWSDGTSYALPNCSFSRVYFYDRFADQVQELQPSKC